MDFLWCSIIVLMPNYEWAYNCCVLWAKRRTLFPRYAYTQIRLHIWLMLKLRSDRWTQYVWRGLFLQYAHYYNKRKRQMEANYWTNENYIYFIPSSKTDSVTFFQYIRFEMKYFLSNPILYIFIFLCNTQL